MKKSSSTKDQLNELNELFASLTMAQEEAEKALSNCKKTFESSQETINDAKRVQERAQRVGVQSSLISTSDAQVRALNNTTVQAGRELTKAKKRMATEVREDANLRRDAESIEQDMTRGDLSPEKMKEIDKRVENLGKGIQRQAKDYEIIIAKTLAEQERRMKGDEVKVTKSTDVLAKKVQKMENESQFSRDNTYWVSSEEDFKRENISKFSGEIKCIIINSNSGINAIPDGAFAAIRTLSCVDLGNCVETIGKGAFNGCDKLSEVKNLGNLKTIGRIAFIGCIALKEISLPNVITIGEGAFVACESLTDFIAPKVTTVANSTFAGCESLSNFKTSSITTIGKGAFYHCGSLSNFEASSVTTIGKEAFAYSGLESFNGSKVENIEDHAFSGCTALETINLPRLNIEDVVDASVFDGCKVLETIIAKVRIQKFSTGGMSDITKKIETQIGKTPVVNFSGRKRLFDGETHVVKTLTKVVKTLTEPEKEDKRGRLKTPKEVLESTLGPIVVINDFVEPIRLRSITEEEFKSAPRKGEKVRIIDLSKHQ